LISLWFAVAFALAQDDKRQEANRLEKKAEQAESERERDRFRAEAWALRAEAFAEEGQWDASRDAWLRARAYGWTGPMPTGRKSDRREGVAEERDRPLGVPKPEWPKEPTLWDRFAFRPYPSTRNGAVHNLVHLPPPEEASVLPAGTWHFQAMADFTLAKFEEEAQGGTTEWKVAHLGALAELDYAILSWLEVGARLAVGELFSAGADVVVFEKGFQIVPPGVRSLNLEWVAPRVKAAVPTPIVDLGFLVEFKIPVASEEDLLTAKTFDLALGALLSRKIGDDFAIHAGGGFILPIAETETFFDNTNLSTLPATNEVATVIHYSAGLVWRPLEILSFGLQAEGNTAVFKNIQVLDKSQLALTLFGRLRMAGDAFGALAVGTGFGDLSADLSVSFTVDLVL